MGVLLHVLLVVAIVIAVLFVLSFVVYILNLDMKMLAALEKPLSKVYDKRKRERKI